MAEVAPSLVLLAGAGLLARSFVALQQVDPGFRAEGLFTARVQPPLVRYPDSPLAAYVLARRSTRVAPVEALRGE